MEEKENDREEDAKREQWEEPLGGSERLGRRK